MEGAYQQYHFPDADAAKDALHALAVYCIEKSGDGRKFPIVRVINSTLEVPNWVVPVLDSLVIKLEKEHLQRQHPRMN